MIDSASFATYTFEWLGMHAGAGAAIPQAAVGLMEAASWTT